MSFLSEVSFNSKFFESDSDSETSPMATPNASIPSSPEHSPRTPRRKPAQVSWGRTVENMTNSLIDQGAFIANEVLKQEVGKS